MINTEVVPKQNLANPIQDFKGVILFGVPRETALLRSNDTRHDNKSLDKPTYNNAEILSLMEHGSPLSKIPARPLLRPVLKKHEEAINNALLGISIALLQGDRKTADTEMERLALRIEGWGKAFFVDSDNHWAPNSPITIHGGWMRNHISGKPIYIKGKQSNRPLIDTGDLRKSIKAIYFPGGSI
jgi:hypothetical protein